MECQWRKNLTQTLEVDVWKQSTRTRMHHDTSSLNLELREGKEKETTGKHVARDLEQMSKKQSTVTAALLWHDSLHIPNNRKK